MKTLLTGLLFVAGCAFAEAPRLESRGGVLLERPWGWALCTAGGTTHIVKQWDGYAVSGPGLNARLIRRYDGYAIAPQPAQVRIVPPDALFDHYYAGRSRPGARGPAVRANAGAGR